MELFRNIIKGEGTLVFSVSGMKQKPANEFLELFNINDVTPSAGISFVRGIGHDQIGHQLKLKIQYPYFPSMTRHLTFDAPDESALFKDQLKRTTGVVSGETFEYIEKSDGTKPEQKFTHYKKLDTVLIGFPFEALSEPNGHKFLSRIIVARGNDIN